MSEVHAILTETRSILQRRGKGFICRSLAQVTCGDSADYNAAYTLIEAALPSSYGGSVLAYSYEPTTTNQDVLDLLDRAVGVAE